MICTHTCGVRFDPENGLECDCEDPPVCERTTEDLDEDDTTQTQEDE